MSETFFPLPETLLGKHEVLDVYAFHDAPRLFTSKDQQGNLFLTIWADVEKTVETWVVAPISADQAQQIRAGELDFRSAFLHPLGGDVQVVRYRRSGSAVAVRTPAEDVPGEWLPVAGEREEQPGFGKGPALMPTDAASFSEKIEELRKDLDISQAELARKAGLDTGLMSRYATGKQAPSPLRCLMFAGLARNESARRYWINESGLDKTALEVLANALGAAAVAMVSTEEQPDYLTKPVYEITDLTELQKRRDHDVATLQAESRKWFDAKTAAEHKNEELVAQFDSRIATLEANFVRVNREANEIDADFHRVVGEREDLKREAFRKDTRILELEQREKKLMDAERERSKSGGVGCVWR